MEYKLITDSSADLTPEMIEKYNITVVPLSVHFGDKEYLNLDPDEFYKMLDSSEEIPKTSQVPPERFIDAFKKVLDEGKKIICVTIGSNASGTFQSAMIAKEELNSQDIILIDSNSLCLGTGYIVIKIAKMLERGEELEKILKEVEYLKNNKIEHLFCVDTLKYLKKGGRIKASKAMIAEVLNIKPVLNVEDAITQPFGKVRGRKKIISFYVNHIKNNIDLDRNEFIIVGHSQDLPHAENMAKALRDEVGYKGEILIGQVGPVIGVHAGPGVLVVFYVKK